MLVAVAEEVTLLMHLGQAPTVSWSVTATNRAANSEKGGGLRGWTRFELWSRFLACDLRYCKEIVMLKLSLTYGRKFLR